VTTLGRYQHQLTELVDSGSQVSCSGRKTYRTQPKVAKFEVFSFFSLSGNAAKDNKVFSFFRVAVNYSLWVPVQSRRSYVDGT